MIRVDKIEFSESQEAEWRAREKFEGLFRGEFRQSDEPAQIYRQIRDKDQGARRWEKTHAGSTRWGSKALSLRHLVDGY